MKVKVRIDGRYFYKTKHIPVFIVKSELVRRLAVTMDEGYSVC